MTRISSFLVLATLACAAAFGGSRSENVTYVDGNLAGVSPNTGGTLLFPDDKSMYFRMGPTTVPIGYANIGKAELGATQVHSHDVPLYKVWKKLGPKTQTQLLTVEFKTEGGENRTMTLELERSGAVGVLSQIETLTAKGTVVEVAQAEPTKSKHKKSRKHETQAKATPPAKTADADQWWGDSMWKTKRNADKWNKSASAAAPDQK